MASDESSSPVTAGRIATAGHAPAAHGEITAHTAQLRGAGGVATAPAGTGAGVPRLPAALEARFETLGVLGQGGAGVVLRARDRLVGREVAIKLLLEGLEHHPKLLQGEATHLAQLEHERIVRLYDFGLTDSGAYLVMEFVRGETLWRRLARARPTLMEALAAGIETCDGMAAAHALGLVHADLKPMNLFLDVAGHVKIADFGLARTVDASGPGDAEAKGNIQGTPGYLAPEQADGKALTPACDVYAIGVILAEMLGGQRLFTGRTPLSILTAQARGPQWRPADVNPAVPAGLDSLVMRCLAKDPGARPTAADLGTELRGWQERLMRATRIPSAAGFPAHPYKLLDHFDGDDAVIFFGRESEVAELTGLVSSEAVRMTLVFGPCGAGKSSLLRAGLARSLEQGAHTTTVLTSGSDPCAGLAAALEESVRRAGTSGDARASGGATANGGTAGSFAEGASADGSGAGSAFDRICLALHELAKRTKKTPVVIVDQLEELFTLNPSDAPVISEFFELVSRLVEDELAPVKLVLSFRTEFRGRFFEMERRLARHTQSYSVTEMREHALAAAIEGPSAIESYQFGYEPGFAQTLARDVLATVAERGDSPAPVLQIVCRQLYDGAKSAGEKLIGPALYERTLGGARGALTRWVEERLRGSGYGVSGSLARQMLRALTVRGAGGERFGHARDSEDLLDFPDRAAARRVLDQLLEDRLVVREDGGGRGHTIRLASEVICPLIDEWAADVDEAERAARLLGRTARQWTENGRKSEDLLTGGALTLVERQLPALRSLSPEERALVDRSLVERRRRRVSTAISSLLIAATMGGAAWFALLRPGTVRLASEPPGASVTGPSGESLGETPLTWTARPGVYQLALSRARYGAQQLTVRVPAGGEASYAPVLSYPYGVLSLTSSPPGARCEIVSASTSATVLTTTTPFHTELPSGHYRVRLSAEACLPREVDGIAIPANRVLVEQLVKLERDTGLLEVRTPRAGTALTVRHAGSHEKVFDGTLPLSPRELTSGNYLLEVRAPDHQSQFLQAEVRRGATTVMSAYPAPMRTAWTHPLPMMARLAQKCPDVDGDGTPDIVAVAGTRSESLIVVSGRTGRRMMTATLDVTPSASSAVAELSLADVDGDGRMDAVAHFTAGPIGVFDLKDAHRILQVPGKRLESAQFAVTPVVLDLNGDRLPDIVTVDDRTVVARSGRDGAVLWQGAGPPRALYLQLAQLDGKGLPEIVVASATGLLGAIDAATGKTLWALSNHQSDAMQEVHFTHADLDGDGGEDILVTSPQGIAAIAGRGDRPLWTRKDAAPFGVVAGHIRAARTVDVVAAFDEKLVAYDGGSGNPLWTVPGGSWFDDPVIADVDADGIGDVVVKRKEELLEAYRGTDGTLLWRLTNTARNHNLTPVMDFNGDGIPDTVRVGSDRNLILTLGAGADAPWTFKVPGEVYGTPPMAYLDGDGELDAVIGCNEPGVSSVQAVTPRTGRQIWRVAMRENSRPSCSLADLDGDGKLDVVVVNMLSEVTGIHGRTGRVLWKRSGLSFTAGASASDLDGDGRAEIVCRAMHPTSAPLHQLFVLDGATGAVRWTSPPLDPRLPLPGRILSGLQKNQDVLVLLAPAAGTPPRLALLDGKSGAVRTVLPFARQPQLGMSLTFGDIDADGKPEVIVSSPGAALEAFSTTRDRPLWSVEMPGPPSNTGFEDQLGLADVDGDGLQDVLYASTTGVTAALSGKDGHTLWTRTLSPPPYTRMALAALDSDDVPDLMFADFEGTVIAASGKTGAPLVTGLRGSMQTVPLVVDPALPGPFTEALTRVGVKNHKPSPTSRVAYITPDGTLVLTPVRQLGLSR